MATASPFNAGIAAGDLPFRITLKQLQFRTEDSGERVPIGYGEAVTVWCSAGTRTGDETLNAGQLQSKVIWDVQIRSGSLVANLDTTWIAVLFGVVMEIRALKFVRIGVTSLELCERDDGESIRRADQVIP